MDWSWVRSHSSFIQSFILSNAILWHLWNAYWSNWMEMREGRFFNSNDSHNLNESRPMIILFNLLSSSITNRFTFIKQSPSISSLSIPFKQSVSNTLKSCECLYSNRFVVLSYSSFIFSRYLLLCRMNRSRESASQSLSINQLYSNYAILSHYNLFPISELNSISYEFFFE